MVSVSNNAFLGGNLQLALLNGFVPSAANTFTVVEAMGNLFGSFANVASGQRLTTSEGLGSFVVHYGAGSPFDPKQIVLSAFQSGLAGDFDVDGDVDGADFVKWQHGGSPNPGSAADLAAWRGNFGFSALTAAGTSIPEPRTEWLALSLTLCVSLFQRRPLLRDGVSSPGLRLN
ncbi:MAG: hypothetical protein H0T51_19540 [Pirellulales bacterium]|nr:hypothetical protein [Pirellulales bacterium]